MSGTTLCPHCRTRFKIAEEQLEAHHGMVRCGHCLQAFDAIPCYIPDKPHPQLELPMLDELVSPIKKHPAITYALQEGSSLREFQVKQPHTTIATSFGDIGPDVDTAQAIEINSSDLPTNAEHAANQKVQLQKGSHDDIFNPSATAETDGHDKFSALDDQTYHDLTLDEITGETTDHLTAPPQNDIPPVNNFSDVHESVAASPVEAGEHSEVARDTGSKANEVQSELHDKDASFPTVQQAAAGLIGQTRTLAEQVVIVHEEEENIRTFTPKYRKWPWVIATSLLALGLLAQAAYFFRVDIAARLPNLKPTLVVYCDLLRCSVPLPQKIGLMSIESSDLEADTTHENHITLYALLRNRAPYAQAFPNLELTLNDSMDKPVARRIFKPADYLPPLENEQIGLLPNYELSVKLHLNIADLKPTGYRLVLFYP